MLHRSDRAQRLGRIMDQLRVADNPSVEVLSSIGKERSRISLSRQSSMAERITSLISTGAWTDAALCLMESELPLWKLRRLVYDDGRWYCAISYQRALPEWLDQPVEADHQNLPLALLSALVGALLQRSASEPVSTPAAPAMDVRYDALGCDNFA